MAGTGFSNAAEAAVLDNATVGFGRTLYLYLFAWGGTAGAGAGNGLTDAGARETNVNLVTGGAFTPATVASGDWSAAVAGAPTSKSLNATKSWTASGSGFGEIVWWALSTVSGATITNNATWDSNASSMVAHGPITTSGGTATYVTVNTGETFQFDATNPIKIQLGDPTDTFA